MSNIKCLDISNIIDICNNKYIFNNLHTNISYGLYQTDNENNYFIYNINKNYPIGFYIDNCNNTSTNDISNIIKYNTINNEPIIIYISTANELSYNNNDYFRFYDVSFNLININNNNINNSLTNSEDNFYFMMNNKYKFISYNLSSDQIFNISGNILENNFNLNATDNSFILTIPNILNNTNNNLHYYLSYQDTSNIIEVSGVLNILLDSSNIKYYYGDISFTIDSSYTTDLSNILLSIKSFPFTNNTSDISNVNLFYYSSTCDFVFNTIDNTINFLRDISLECLNTISQANLINNNTCYELNLNNHYTSDLCYNNLNYGIVNGSYTIFDICINYPITIENFELSNNIFIDENYFRTEIIPQNSINLKSFYENNNIDYSYNFYYGAIRLIVNNLSDLLDDISINIIMLKKNNNNYEKIDISNKLIYNSLCEILINNKGINNSQFFIYTKNDISFNTNYSDYIFDLEKYQNYNEPNKKPYANDRYNHDISNLIIYQNFYSTIDISNITNNYNNNIFLLNYILIDYEDNFFELTRIVEIKNGPYITFSNEELNITHLIDISINNQYDFNYSDISCYIYNISGELINLPYSIELSGIKINNDNNLTNIIVKNNRNLDDNQGTNFQFIRYDYDKCISKIYIDSNINNLDVILDGTSINNINFVKHYISYFLDITSADFIKIENISTNSFNNISNKDITFLNLQNTDSEFFNNDNSIKIDEKFLSSKELLNGNIREKTYIINVINNTIYFNNNDISSSLFINNERFHLIMTDINNANNKLDISGNFNPIDIFNNLNNSLNINHFIDTSYIGNYNINIIPLGITNEDYIYSNFLSNVTINNNFSKNLTVIVNDKINPIISFNNSNQTNAGSNLIYSLPLLDSFNILNDDIIFSKDTTNNNLNNLPYIKYNDNSLYNGNLDYNIETSNNITIINENTILPIDINIDASAVINYFAYDICNNKSNDISLVVLFKKIALLTLSGEQNINIPLNTSSYFDDGINIDNNFIITQDNSNNFEYNISNSLNSRGFSLTVFNDICYNISIVSDLSLTNIGDYKITYFVTISGESVIDNCNNIIRNVLVRDNSKPFFKFPDLVSINIINDISDSNYITNSNLTIDYKFDNSNQFIIDFSLNFNSNFSDLSAILYNFDISDNKFDINNSDVSINLKLNNNNIQFTLEDLSNSNIINSDGSFIIVSKGINSFGHLSFEYIVNDPCNNTFTAIRNVNIINNTKPSIEFVDFSQTLINNTIDYVIIGDNNKDFSYVALDYNINNNLFINEISSILFNFNIEDNFSLHNDISNNYKITLISEDFSFIINNNGDNLSDPSFTQFFKIIDSSFILHYDFSDNQYNDSSINRIVNIFNNVKPNIDFSSNIIDPSLITLLSNKYANVDFTNIIISNYGDISLNFNELTNQNFILTHSRLNNSSIDIELSYNLPNIFSSISGDSVLFDPSALIYSELTETSFNYAYALHNINFYSVIKNTELISENISISFELLYSGPVFNDINVINHEAGIYISDASLIDQVYAYSIYDAFYYYHNISDICYSYTNYDISFENNFDQLHPEIGIYNIKYTATDVLNIKREYLRKINIIDNIAPTIILQPFDNSINITINQFEELLEPGFTINDIGSDISYIKIDFLNINIGISITLFDLSRSNINSKNYTNNNIVIPTTENGNFKLIYNTADIYNNKSSVDRIIDILNEDFIFTKYLQIKDNSNSRIILNRFFDQCFNDLSNIYSDYNISYSISKNIKKLDYQVTSKNLFENLEFGFNATYNGNDILENNKNIINTIVFDGSFLNLTNYDIIFQAYERENFNSKNEVININFYNNKNPILNFNATTDINYPDICNIIVPLLSQSIYTELSNNINFFNDIITNAYKFTYDISNKLIYSLPTITINDIINVFNSLNNETLISDPRYNNYILTIDYSNNIQNNYKLNEILTISGNYEQIYTINISSRSNVIKRNIIVEELPPYIEVNYETDISNNIYNKFYHLVYENFNIDNNFINNNVNVYDYYDNSINKSNINILKNINSDNLGLQNFEFDITNIFGKTTTTNLDFEIVDIKCLPRNIGDINYLINNISINNKYGLYDGSYNINIDNSSNAINIKSYNHSKNGNIETDISYINNGITITSSNNVLFNNEIYYYGNITINVTGDFNRATLKIIDGTIHKDLFLYNSKCSVNINNFYNIIENKYKVNEFKIDISNINNNPFIQINNFSNDIIAYKSIPLYLNVGIYRFYQYNYKNFYNKIKFSYIPDGYHYNTKNYTNDFSYIYNDFRLFNNLEISFNSINDASYQKYNYIKNIDIFNKTSTNLNLAGFNNFYTEIIIDYTTPSTLYYYNEHFPNMGGIIYINNNVNISKNNYILNSSVLSIDQSNCLTNTEYDISYSTNDLQNKIFIIHNFDISSVNSSHNYKTNKNIFCLTQQNIQHNLVLSNDKLFIKKFQSVNELTQNDISSNYIIKIDNSNNYLLNNSINNLNSNIICFDYYIDTSVNILKNNSLYNYKLKNENLFYNLLDNYVYYFKKYNLLNYNTTIDDFIYKINELISINNVKIKYNDEEFNYYNDIFYDSNNIIFDSIIDNILTFNYQVYLKESNLKTNLNNDNFYNFIKKNVLYDFNNNVINYNIDDNNLFFKEFLVTIYSDICGNFIEYIDPSYQDIVFSNGVIELLNYPIDSSGSKDLLKYLYNDISNNDASFNNELKNKVFLNILDNNNVLSFNGITQQNIFHNMFINESNQIIFHEYNSSILNYQINDPSISLVDILDLSSNNNKYLFEISNNDLYNCFSNKTIYENISSKNTIFGALDANTSINSYKLHIQLFNKSELNNNNIILNNNNINTYTLNNIDYNIYPYTYNEELQINHSHTYIIDLLDYFDRFIYKDNSYIEIPYTNINTSKISFVIKDVSYNNKSANIYDLTINRPIIYDKSEIDRLNYLQLFIKIINFKFDYLYKLIIQYVSNDLPNLTNNYKGINFELIHNINIQNVFKVINTLEDTILPTYNFTLKNTLNELYYIVFYNSTIIKNKYNETIDIFMNDLLSGIIDPQDFYISFGNNYNTIDEIDRDLSNINFNLDNFYYNELAVKFSNDDGENILLRNTPQLIPYIHLNKFQNIVMDYTYIIEYFTATSFEISLRFDNSFNTIYTNTAFVDIEQFDKIENYMPNFKNNLYLLDNLIIGLLNDANNIGINIPDFNKISFDFSSNAISIDTSFIELSNNFINISKNFNIMVNTLNDRFDYLSKKDIYDDINYVINGSSLVINSFRGNNLLFKIDMIYNSFLYPNKYIDTLILDIFIPDLTPPTIIFKEETIILDQAFNNNQEIDIIINQLIEDISYVDQTILENDFTINNLNYSFINSNDISNVINNIYSLIYIDLSSVADNTGFDNNNRKNIDIIYTIKDNANNINTIKRNVILKSQFLRPGFYYNNILINDDFNEFPIVIKNKSILTENILKENISIRNPENNNELININIMNINFINTLFELNKIIDLSSLVYNNVIEYSILLNNIITTKKRSIIIEDEIIEVEDIKIKHCCYPKVYYKEIQHLYKQGASSSSASRRSKIIINGLYF